MNAEHAEHTLETIRTLMERSQRYEHISGYSGLIAGGAVGVGCLLLATGWLPYDIRANFAVVWASVFVVAATAHIILTFTRARQRGEPVWSRQAKAVYTAILPGLLVAGAVTSLMSHLDHLDLLPGLWLLLYGCSTLATGFFAPRSIRHLGSACLILGVVAVAFLPGQPLLTMAVGFGLTHITYGACVLIAERREQHAQTFWAEVQQLADSDLT